jgi:N-acyl-D-aspartate/D-glutamate deacylase
MTALPAEKLKLTDRGKIRKGYAADLAVFNPDSIRDKATYLEPWHYSEGFDNLIVNGQVVIEKDRQTESLPGRVLLRG